MLFNGLKADYYIISRDDETFALKELVGVEVETNLNFDDLKPTLKSNAGRDEFVGIRFTGKIAPKVTGDHTFYIVGDNGFRLWVNNELLIDFWKNEWDKLQTSPTIKLEEGKKYDFKLEYFQAEGGANLHVSWSAPGLEKEPIPSSALFVSEDYTGPFVAEILTNEASLVQNRGKGAIVIRGKNLLGSNVELLDITGQSFTPALNLKVLDIPKATDEQIVCKVPEKLPVGKLRVAVSKENQKDRRNIIMSKADFGKFGPRPEYPRPDWQREKWINLNGTWRFDFDKEEIGEESSWYKEHDFSKKINVPFPWESALSGIHEPDYRGMAWYERDIRLDSTWFGKRIMLNFGAVDWRCKVWINGELVGSHEGGYTPFEFDVTDIVKINDINKLTVLVEDNRYKEGNHVQLIGKQGHDTPCGYTPSSGIWQTVYLVGLESDYYLQHALATPDVDNSAVSFDVKIINKSTSDKVVNISYDFKGTIHDKLNGSEFNGELNQVTLKPGENKITIKAQIPDQKLWNFDSPNLYEGFFQLKDESGKLLDKVNTYFGQRKISIEKFADRWYEYIYINDKPVFLSGLLDQGFWPEGLYTAPSDEALKNDITDMVELGFNMNRKHIKIEDPRQLYWADKYGMFFWADMPWGPGFDTQEGRDAYEYTLEKMIERDYNHPSLIAIILFNETWGITHNDSTHDWMKHLYEKVKELYPSYIVEDMSPCNWDHIQPTDIFTFHMYPKRYEEANKFVNDINENSGIGSTYMFRTDRPEFKNQGEPWLNSEFGGVAAYDGDHDVSWCFKYQLDIQRLHERLCGFVYTEPYDIEYECNGILNYDRTKKIFGYDECTFDGDMSINYLTQPDYVGFFNAPIETIAPGDTFTAEIGAMNWSGNNYENLTFKWRFEGTNRYGEYCNPEISGSMPITFAPYTQDRLSFSFTVPNTSEFEKFVGAVTGWIEDSEGKVIAKNFTNLVVTNGKATPEVEKLEDAIALRQPSIGVAEQSAEYTYTVPEDFDLSSLKSVKVIAEVSSNKPGNSQTAEGEEAPSDVTISINGHEVIEALLPDNPRDIRGTLSLDHNKPSAGNYGYLLNIDVPVDVVEKLKKDLAANRTITVKYEIKEDAENNNGLRFYGETEGRYAVTPMVILK